MNYRMSRIDKIIGLIKEEAKTIRNPDPVSRLYAAKLRVGIVIAGEMESIRAREPEQKKEEDPEAS